MGIGRTRTWGRATAAGRSTLKVAPWVIGAAVSLLACACGGTNGRSEDLATTSTAIVNGRPSGGARDAVVDIKVHKVDGANVNDEHCSGVLLAPNLLVTAKHCVFAYMVTECSPDGTPPAGSKGFADEGVALAVITPNDTILAQKARVLTLESSSFCRDDVAFVVLDKPIVGPIAPLRVTRETRVGEAVVVAGYGDTTDGPSIGARFERSDLTISSVGPASAIGEGGGSVAGTPRTFTLPGGAICFGDSGGGIYSKETGAVIGIPSRFGASDNFGKLASCLDVRAFLTSVDLMRYTPLTDQAFAAAGHPRWNEGAPHPNEGASCATDADCNGIPCALPEGRCAQRCNDEQPCPTAFRCAPAGVSLEAREACVARPMVADAGAATEGATPESSPFRTACSVSHSQGAPGAARDAPLAAFAFASLAFCVGASTRASRRRRGPRV